MSLTFQSFTALLDVDANGKNTVAGRSMTVSLKSGGFADIFTDDLGVFPIPQPGAVTNSIGVFEFYVAPGEYILSDGVRNQGFTAVSLFEEKTVTLTSGQLIVNFTGVNVNFASIYISNVGVDRGRLKLVDDYSITSQSQITLTNSFPENAVCTAIFAIDTGLPQEVSTSSGKGPMEVIAHRGFRDTGFQNTLLSLSYAKRFGADSLEFDVSITSDGIFYLFHDFTLDALTDGTGNFIAASSATIDGLKYDEGVGTAFDELRISKFDDALALVKEKGIKAYIEMKNLRNNAADVVLFMDKINSYGLIEHVNVQSFVTAQLISARAAYPNADLALTLGSSNHAQNIIDAKAAGANMVINAFSLISTSADTALYADAGLDLAVYTVETAAQFQSLARIGVRKIMTDRSAFK